MAAIAISPAVQLSNSPEARKALSVPVPGAVVIAPLTQSWRNYGSVGGTFTRTGTPTLSSDGATFNGTDQAAWLIGTPVTSFTLVTRCKWNRIANDSSAANKGGVLVGAMKSTGTVTSSGVSAEAFNSVFALLHDGVARTNDGSADLAWHTITITRNAATTTSVLYIDGVSRASRVGAMVAAEALVMLAISNWAQPMTVYASGVVRNSVLYSAVLSAPDQALVEAWASASIAT